MINNTQFRALIVRPGLSMIGKYCPKAEELLVATMAHESLGGTYLAQVSGPAMGIYEMEEPTYDDCWANVISRQPAIKSMISSFVGTSFKPNPVRMIWDLQYATIMARMEYSRFDEPLPEANDIHAIYAYYKKYWNSSKGAANGEDFIQHYQTFIKV